MFRLSHPTFCKQWLCNSWAHLQHCACASQGTCLVLDYFVLRARVSFTWRNGGITAVSWLRPLGQPWEERTWCIHHELQSMIWCIQLYESFSSCLTSCEWNPWSQGIQSCFLGVDISQLTSQLLLYTFLGQIKEINYLCWLHLLYWHYLTVTTFQTWTSLLYCKSKFRM